MATSSNSRTLRIRVGGVSQPEIRRRFAEANIKLNSLGEQLLDDIRFVTTDRASWVEVAFVTVADMGFDHGATFEEVVDKAVDRGLSLCPLELAAHLRLQLTDQAEGALGQPPTQHRAPPGSITVMSTPGDDDLPWGFYLRRINGTLWLRGYRSWSGHVWNPQDLLAFVSEPNADGRTPRSGAEAS